MSLTDPTLAQINMFAGNFNPRGWVNCDGQLLAIAQNTALFSLMGTMYGGDGRTTFGVPEMRGRVPMHVGNGPGLTNRTQGQTGGTETNNITVAQLPAHGHAINAREEGNTDDPNNAFIAGNGMNSFGSNSDVAMAGTSVGNTGSNQPVNNMQPFKVVRFVLATVGTFPSRS